MPENVRPDDVISNKGPAPTQPGDRRGPVRLPMVIRPVQPRLRDVEQRARHDAAFARVLQKRPDLCSTLARALLVRDAAARARFADHSALVDHLHSLRAG